LRALFPTLPIGPPACDAGGMGKVVVLILALALVAFVAKTALDRTASPPEAHSAPRRQLDQVRSKAHDLEQQQQESVDKAEVQADTK
jgi:hypothetical protein